MTKPKISNAVPSPTGKEAMLFRCMESDKAHEHYDIDTQEMMKNHLVMNYK